ncbi:MAG: hypothetical protein RL083_1959, partial [Pseudomonadota bacterium]
GYFLLKLLEFVASQRGVSRQHTDCAGFCERSCWLEPRFDTNDMQAWVGGAQGRDGRRSGGIASDNNGLDSEAQQKRCDGQNALDDHGLGFFSVRGKTRISEVNQSLGGQKRTHMTQHRQPTNARIENTDWRIRRESDFGLSQV